MSNQKIPPFNVIGISIGTTNENGQSSRDIPALWNKFISEGIREKIPGKMASSIYCIYTDYEKDHTKPYTTIIGCQVENSVIAPNGMVGRNFEGGNYLKCIAKGNISQEMVFNEWVKIWNSNLPRIFTADFEVYGEKTQNPENAEVDIFVAIK